MASFAGQHLTRINVCGASALTEAVWAVWHSASTDSALAYRRRLAIPGPVRIAVVIQRLVAPDTAGVLFTRNPVTGMDERVIEASWGFGEVVVAGRVIPDRFRISRSGDMLERAPGLKGVAIRMQPDGGTVEQQVSPELVERLCLNDAQLSQLNQLASRCEEVFGGAQDLEWAFADGELYLLQRRTTTGMHASNF